MLTAVTQRQLSVALRTQLRSPSVYPIIGHVSRKLSELAERRLSTAAAAQQLPSSISPTLTFFDINGQMYYPQNASDLVSEARQMDKVNETMIKRFSPRYEIEENDNFVKVKIDLPNAKAEDLFSHVEDGNLLHVGGWVEEKRFDQRFTVGTRVDVSNVKAKLESDVLTVSAPKIGTKKVIQVIPVV